MRYEVQQHDGYRWQTVLNTDQRKQAQQTFEDQWEAGQQMRILRDGATIARTPSVARAASACFDDHHYIDG